MRQSLTKLGKVDDIDILRQLTWRSTDDKKDAVMSVRLLAHVLAGDADRPFELLSISLQSEAIRVVNALHDGGLLMKTLERTLYWHFHKRKPKNTLAGWANVIEQQGQQSRRVQLRQRG